jgi:hypothetical protein
MSDGVSWSQGVDDSWGVRVLLYVGGGVPLGVAIVAAVLLGRAGVLAIRTGRYSVAVAVIFVFAVAAVVSRRADPSLVSVEPTPELSFQTYRFTWLVVAAMAGAGFVVLAAWAGSVWFFAAVFAGLGVPLVTAGLFTSEGHIDRENRILHYGDEAFVLDELAAIREFSIGNSVLLWCRFVPGAGRTPTLLVVPADVLAEARGAIERGIEEDIDFGRVDHPTRVVSSLFAGLLFGLAALSVAVMWSAPLIAIYAGGSLGLLGVFVLILGRAGL